MQEKKRVIIFKRKLLAVSETFIRDQAIALKDSKAWLPILLARKKDKNGIDIPSVQQVYAPMKLSFLEDLFYLFNWPFLGLRKKLKTLQPDILHIHFGTQAVKFWPTFKTLNIPTLVTLHGTDINLYKEYWHSGKKGLAGRFYPERLLTMARHPNVHILAVSEAIKKRAIEYGIPENKITVSYIGTDTSRFKPSTTPIGQRDNKILFVGRFIENKGPDLLIRAFTAVQKKIPDAQLVMIGEGPLKQSCTNLANELQVNVNFLGAQSSSEIARQLDTSKAFCLPSITILNGASEGFGIVLLEAMASGVPCITSARGGAGEAVVNNETGICFAERDTAALANGLITILSNNELAERFSVEGIKRVQALFDNKITSQHLTDIYDKFIVEKKG